jgi:uncharacterized protein DUF3800
MSWFVRVGEHRFEFVSFNDDSSPDQRLTGEKVSIHAQVMPGKDLTWYYNIIPLFPVTGEELKSRRVIETFNAMPSGKREAYWRNGLSDVRIHIVDPTLPKRRIESMLRSVFRRDDALQWLEREVRDGNPVARTILGFAREHLAESIILFNSSAGKLHHLIEFHKKDSYIPPGSSRASEDEPLPISLTDFGCNSRSVVRKATEWSTKSAAAFHDGIDDYYDALRWDFENVRFLTMGRSLQSILPRLNERHAFDRGDEKQLRALESFRRKTVSNIMAASPYYLHPRLLLGKAYEHEESHESVLVQAADFAAGIASYFYTEPRGLVEIVSRFAYVTFNGKRISMTDAEEIIRRTLSGMGD